MRNLLARLRDPHWVVYTTPGVGRVFLACKQCGRTVPHYQAAYSAEEATRHRPGCRGCGHPYYTYRALPTWKAVWWVLIVGVLWRKTLMRRERWDPRTPVLL